MRTGSPLAVIHAGGSVRTCFIQRPPCSRRPAPNERRRALINCFIAGSAPRSSGPAGGAGTNCDSSNDIGAVLPGPVDGATSPCAASRATVAACGRGATGRAPTRSGSGAAIGMPAGSSETLGLRSSGRRKRQAISGNLLPSTTTNVPISPLL